MVRLIHCIPGRIAARRKSKKAVIEEELKKLSNGAIAMPFLVATRNAKWATGSRISVAFASGSTGVHEAIEAAASTWSKYANLTFDFRDPRTGKFRRWTRNDHSYAADIRIAFKANDGFWSAVGAESTDCKIFLPNEPSMNYDGFSRELPDDWKGYVLHEFGHAIGLQHEHQHPAQPCDWRWEDDEGYKIKRTGGEAVPDRKGRRPGLYTVFGGPPNNWSRSDVDDNLKELGDSAAYDFGSFDKESIMKYFFDDWLFVAGKKSHCYRPHDATRLSPEDKLRIAAFYPAPSTLAATTAAAEKSAGSPVAEMSIDEMIAAVSSSALLVHELQRVRQLRR
jgi:hypothetical protein